MFTGLWKLGNWGTGEVGNWGTGELGNWGIGELGNWGTGELGNWGIRRNTHNQLFVFYFKLILFKFLFC